MQACLRKHRHGKQTRHTAVTQTQGRLMHEAFVKNVGNCSAQPPAISACKAPRGPQASAPYPTPHLLMLRRLAARRADGRCVALAVGALHGHVQVLLAQEQRHVLLGGQRAGGGAGWEGVGQFSGEFLVTTMKFLKKDPESPCSPVPLLVISCDLG